MLGVVHETPKRIRELSLAAGPFHEQARYIDALASSVNLVMCEEGLTSLVRTKPSISLQDHDVTRAAIGSDESVMALCNGPWEVEHVSWKDRYHSSASKRLLAQLVDSAFTLDSSDWLHYEQLAWQRRFGRFLRQIWPLDCPESQFTRYIRASRSALLAQRARAIALEFPPQTAFALVIGAAHEEEVLQFLAHPDLHGIYSLYHLSSHPGSKNGASQAAVGA